MTAIKFKIAVELPFITIQLTLKTMFMQCIISTCLLVRRFDFSRKAGELEARETGDEHARDHGKEKGERRNACEKTCRFFGNFVVFLSWYFSRVFKPY